MLHHNSIKASADKFVAHGRSIPESILQTFLDLFGARGYTEFSSHSTRIITERYRVEIISLVPLYIPPRGFSAPYLGIVAAAAK